jgi:hypothetical protein
VSTLVKRIAISFGIAASLAAILVMAAMLYLSPMTAAYTAKEYCSCRFVMKQLPDQCAIYVKQIVPASVIESPHSIEAQSLFSEARATVVSDGACQLGVSL